MSDANELLRFLARDLCILTYEEMQTAWTPEMQQAIALTSGKSWKELVPETHNPIYYLAEKVVFANVAGDPEFLYAPTHRDIVCAALLAYYQLPEGEEKAGLLLLMQRDSFKSTFMHIVMPMFVAFREKRLLKRDTRVLLVHYKQLQASMNLVRLKGILASSEFLKWAYPEFCLQSADEGAKDAFFYPGVRPGPQAEPSVFAIGITGDVTGLHFNHVFFSDLVTKEARTSKVIREQVEALHEAMLYILSTGKNKRWYDGTFYHIHDLWQKMVAANIEGAPLYSVVKIPAYDPAKDWYSLPMRHTQKRLEFMRQEEISRTGNDFMFCLQMLLEPRSSKLIAGDRRWYRWCKQGDIPREAWFLILVDGAWKGTHNAGEGDYASIQVWALERRGLHIFSYLVDGTRSNAFTSFDGEREIIRLMRKYDVMDVGVEEHGGHAFRTSLQDAANKAGLVYNEIEFKTKQTGKQGRMSAFLKDAEQGLVFLCEECDEDILDALQEQTDDFPQCIDEICDDIDAAAYGKDPNVRDQFAPATRTVGARQSRAYRDSAVTYERRTRHCMA